jgi:hypothetical protein
MWLSAEGSLKFFIPKEESGMKEYEQNHNGDSKEDIIQHLIQSGCYKSSDGRQLYELTLFELAHEYDNSLHE